MNRRHFFGLLAAAPVAAAAVSLLPHEPEVFASAGEWTQPQDGFETYTIEVFGGGGGGGYNGAGRSRSVKVTGVDADGWALVAPR